MEGTMYFSIAGGMAMGAGVWALVKAGLAAARAIVGRVELRSRLLPPINVEVSGPSGPPSTAGRLVRALQPAVTVRSPLGTFVLAPYGEPDPGAWKGNLAAVIAGVAAVGGLATIVGLRIGRALERRARRGA